MELPNLIIVEMEIGLENIAEDWSYQSVTGHGVQRPTAGRSSFKGERHLLGNRLLFQCLVRSPGLSLLSVQIHFQM